MTSRAPKTIPWDDDYAALVMIAMSGPLQGQRIPLDRPILLGRDSRAGVCFNDERVSRHHALIDMEDGRQVLRDLGSKNGTFVNGREITSPHVLKPSDRIRLGKTQLAVFKAEDDNPPTPPPPTGETRADESPAKGGSGAEHLRIDRRTLRRAAEIASRITALVKTRNSLSAVVAAFRKEFQATAAGLFAIGDNLEPAFIDGDLGLGPAQAELVQQRIQNDHPLAVFFLPEQRSGGDRLLALPIRSESSSTFVMVLRSDPQHSFSGEEEALGATLAEMLRVIPFEHLVREGAPAALADDLGIIGSSEVMSRLREQLGVIAATDGTVLIRGESGTGKELSARAIAHLSPRRFGPFVEVNCACMMPELIEAELFGHERGAFTGAAERRLGKLEIADGGTLFLDEVGEIPPGLQAKLLRVLEGQAFYRLGGSKLIRADVRFICATNRNLEQMVNEGRFRADLFHRINVFGIVLPPLRDHLEDIPELASYLIGQIQPQPPGHGQYTITPKAYRRLLSHSWPGNVRELSNVLQRIILLSSSNVIDEPMIPADIGDEDSSSTTKLPRLQMLTEMIEREEIARAMMEAQGQKSSAAKLLGISRPTLDKKIKQYGLGQLAAKRDKPPKTPQSN